MNAILKRSMLASALSQGLSLTPGTRIEFTTPYGVNAGQREGIIESRNIPSPGGFLGGMGFLGHYLVKSFNARWGQTVTIIVTPDMVTRVISSPSQAKTEEPK